MTQTMHTQEDQYNLTFCILAALTIIMVVAGHCGYHILTVGELFPYYSFHVPLFMFISGYFYKDSEEEKPLNYVKKKLSRLIVPYMIWNLIYGLIAWAMRAAGFAMGEGISFRTLFIAPFLHGYQFIYNYAAWFVPVLFVVEMMNLLARIILRNVIRGVWHFYKKVSDRTVEESDLSKEKEGNITEWIMLTGSLLVGITVVWLAIGGHVWGYYKMPGKILLLFPCFQMGQFYLKKLEKHDTLGNVPYFAVLIGIQVILNVFFNGLAFSAVWCTGFANGPVMPYITIISGIAFWLRVAKIITPAVEKSRTVQYLGRNTYAVMMHHVMAFMIVKIVIAAVAARTGACVDFDFEQFYTNIDYYYLVRGAEQFEMVYLAAGVIVPLGIQVGLDRMKSRIAFAIRR
ncbi:MAG: acyltransferase family protein [Lachnospiraceae bacterium]|nr:acyltransferase family protein [Lachnospiraceae bacterium]